MPDRHSYQFTVSDVFCSNQRGKDHDTDTLFITINTGGATYQSQFDLGDVRTGDRIPGPFRTPSIDVVDGDDVTVHWAICNLNGSDAGEILGDAARVGAAIVAIVAAYAGNMADFKTANGPDAFLKATEVFADAVLGVVMGIGAVSDFLSSLFTSTLPDCRGPVVDVGETWASSEVTNHLAPDVHRQITSRSPSECGLDPHTDFTTSVTETDVPSLTGSTAGKATSVLPLAGSPAGAWDGTWGDADFDESCRVLVTIATTTSPAFAGVSDVAGLAASAAAEVRARLATPELASVFARDPSASRSATLAAALAPAVAAPAAGVALAAGSTALAALPPQRRVDVVERELTTGTQHAAVQQTLLVDVPMATTAFAGPVFELDFHRGLGGVEFTTSSSAPAAAPTAQIHLSPVGGELLHDVHIETPAGAVGGTAGVAGAGALAAATAPAPLVSTMVPQPGITLSLYGAYDDAMQLVDHRVRYTRREDSTVMTDVMLTRTAGHAPR